MRLTIFCNHFRSMANHDTCEAGIAYDTMKGVPFDQRPCFARHGNPAPGGCDKAKFPTPEEIAAEEAESQNMMVNIGMARTLMVAHLGGPWKKGMGGSSGAIDCPKCGAVKALRFTRSGYNGHIHARCATKECISWIE